MPKVSPLRRILVPENSTYSKLTTEVTEKIDLNSKSYDKYNWNQG